MKYILFIVLLICNLSMYCQTYDYTEKDIVVYDNSNKYIFHNALYPTVSYFMCKDSVKSNVFYVHYEASSIVKKEFILQVMFKDGKLFLIGELVTINMSSQVEEMGFSPVMLIKGNQELSKEIIPLWSTDSFKWKSFYKKTDNNKCLILNSDMSFINSVIYPSSMDFDYELFIFIQKQLKNEKNSIKIR